MKTGVGILRKIRDLLRLIRAAIMPHYDYRKRIENELRHYVGCANVHELPQIFHYWSNKYLAPVFNRFGVTDPEQFYFVYARKFHERFPDQTINIASIGCGNCDMEARLARRLLDAGITRFSILCQDINQTMLERGRQHAAEAQVSEYLTTERSDFNRWEPRQSYDIVIANQCLHHVVKLENLFAAIRSHLNPEGYLLTCDMIGRNGHQRWPEADVVVREFWKELPDAYRYNCLMNRHEPEPINHDCSRAGFEGIRAQDILPLLIQHFHFEFFVPYSNIITVFIDRAFGHNFNEQGEWDRDFVDRVHARDEQGILNGEWKPVQMLAALRTVPVTAALADPRLTPEFCVRRPD